MIRPGHSLRINESCGRPAAIVLPWLWLGLVGCSTTPASRYPQFAAEASEARELSVVVDVCMAMDVRGDIDLIALEHNDPLAERITAHVQYELENQGYRVDTNLVTSVGNTLGTNTGAKAIVALVDNPEDVEIVPLPHFVHAHGLSDAERQSIAGLYEALLQLHPGPIESPNRHLRKNSSEVRCNQTYFQEGIGLVVLVAGRQKMHMKTFGATYVSVAAELAAIAVLGVPVPLWGIPWIPDTTRISVWAVDADSNRILWHDGVTLEGVESEDILEKLDWVLRRLPDRPVQ